MWIKFDATTMAVRQDDSGDETNVCALRRQTHTTTHDNYCPGMLTPESVVANCIRGTIDINFFVEVGLGDLLLCCVSRFGVDLAGRVACLASALRPLQRKSRSGTESWTLAKDQRSRQTFSPCAVAPLLPFKGLTKKRFPSPTTIAPGAMLA